MSICPTILGKVRLYKFPDKPGKFLYTKPLGGFKLTTTKIPASFDNYISAEYFVKYTKLRWDQVVCWEYKNKYHFFPIYYKAEYLTEDDIIIMDIIE